MSSEGRGQGQAEPARAAPTSAPRMARRTALGHIAAGGSLGAAAWVTPQILTATPTAAAALSGSPGGGGTGPGTGGDTGDGGGTTPPPQVTTAADTTPTTTPAPATASSTTDGAAPTNTGALAETGVDLQGHTEIGALMVAAGWAVHRWASRVPTELTAAHARKGPAHAAGRNRTPRPGP